MSRYFFKYSLSIMLILLFTTACKKNENKQEQKETTTRQQDTIGLNQNIDYKLIYEDSDVNQYIADIYLPEFNRENGEKVLNKYIDKYKSSKYMGLHITFWNKEFTEKQMRDYNDDKYNPPKGTKNFLANYGYKKGFKEIQNIFEF